MRFAKASAAARPRVSSCWVTFSVRPISSSSNLPIRASSVVRDLLRAIAENAVDLLALGSDRRRRGWRRARLIVLVTSLMRVSSAATTSLPPSAEVLRDLEDTAAEGIVQCLGAAVERFLEADQTQVERIGDFAGLVADAAVEIVDAGADRVGDRLGAVAKPLDEFGAMQLHGAIEFAEMAGDQVSER